MSLTPPIGASGIYTLASPYSTLYKTGVTYTCKAVRRLSEVIKNGTEPYSAYYATVSLDETTYNTDVANDECIVTLVSTGGDWLYVPTSYISSYPNANGIAYHSIVLAAHIGAIPTYMDLTSLKTKFSNLIRDNIGITPDIQEVVVSKEKMLSIADHNTVEAARVANITDTTTDSAKVITLTAENTSLRQKLTELETYITTHLS